MCRRTKNPGGTWTYNGLDVGEGQHFFMLLYRNDYYLLPDTYRLSFTTSHERAMIDMQHHIFTTEDGTPLKDAPKEVRVLFELVFHRDGIEMVARQPWAPLGVQLQKIASEGLS